MQDHGKRGPADPGNTTLYDAAKHVVGRKRHIAVDSLGLLWARSVSAASVQDRDGARELLVQIEAHSRRLVRLFADRAYKGALQDVAAYCYGWQLDIVAKPANQKGFVVLPKRWIVERTFAWMSKNRRLSKDYEFQPQSSEAMLDWAMIAHMLRRLTKPHT